MEVNTMADKTMSYEIDKHRHHFSVWAAARATQRGFSADVGTLRKALETCGIVEFLKAEVRDEINTARFDELHRKWCMAIISTLKTANGGSIRDVKFGRATKLIAVYIKCVVVLGPHSETAFARIAHPPIDGILLRNLARSDVNAKHKREWAKTTWTTLSDAQYYDLINQLRQVLDADEPFWKLERFWTVTKNAQLH
jgi:hypothetical protein